MILIRIVLAWLAMLSLSPFALPFVALWAYLFETFLDWRNP